MVASVTHTFVSAIADGGDASLVRPSNWNAGHTLAGLPVLLASGSFAGSSTLDIVLTSYTSYRAIKFFLTGVTVSVDGAGLYARTSTNGGVSYDAGASDYSWSYASQTVFDVADSQIVIDGLNIGNAAGEHSEWEITLFNQASATLKTMMSWCGGYVFTTGVCNDVTGAGIRMTAADVDAIRFLPSSGTFSGNYAVYGIA